MMFIVLNGPPASGKSTIARALCNALAPRYRTISDSFAAPMKHFVATALGEKYSEMPKDSPRDIFRGSSVREVLIHLSEHYMKERYGQDIYGRLLYYRALRYPEKPAFIVCDEGGFIDELQALDNYFLVKVIRQGKGFDNDSRSYLPDPHYIYYNDTTLDEMWIRIRPLVQAIEEFTGV